MNIFYVLSVLYLVILFLLYRKTNKELCLLSSIIYTIGLLFCYNTFIVFLIYLLGMNGSILLYSIINYIIGTIMLWITFIKNKQIQKYYFDKRKLVVILCVGVIIFLIGCFRFRNFEAISFESGDSAVHYRHALEFSEDLSILDETNSQDDVFNAFVRIMPISYVNCGLLFNIFSEAKTYIIFSYYNVLCLVIGALVFLITVIDIFKYRKNDYIYALVITLFYTLAFPFNNFLMGFCYLSLSIIVINLLYLTVFHFKDEFNNNITFKIITILLLTFSIFCSYYLFVPVIYLALGIYYILLWRKKKINFKQMCLYGIITLIIPFIIGFYYFLITLFIDQGADSITKLIGLWGYSYNNITPMYLFVLLTGYFVYSFIKKKEFTNIKEIDYLKLNIYIISLCIAFFIILLLFKVSDLYYFYKLFSLYWLLITLFFIPQISKIKHAFYIFLVILLMINVLVYSCYDNSIVEFIKKTNIYTWNTVTLIDEKIVYEKEELEILEESKKYYDTCVQNNRFLMLGIAEKNLWFYSVTDIIPVFYDVTGDLTKLNIRNTFNFNIWRDVLKEYNCLIYYYEMGEINIDETKYEILYGNETGAIIKRME